MSAAARPLAVLGVILLVGTAWPTAAALTTLAGLFEAADYEAARAALAGGGDGSRPAEEALWRSRLETDPAAAVTLLETALAAGRTDQTVRVRLALEIADIQAGRGRHREALQALSPLLGDAPDALPGMVHLRAGLSLRALGQLQQAREMLASVRPNDPQFVLARFYLGDIALEQEDPPLAQRYFKAAAKATDEAGRSRLAAGLWRTHMAQGEDGQARRLVADLESDDPGSLSLLEIRRLVQVAADERQAREPAAEAERTVERPRDTSGRFALQLGAFSDRGLALEFQRRFASQLPDLRIDKTRDARGQFLYKVRSGNYVNPAQARTAARQLADRLGIEVIVADLSDAVGQGGD